MALGCHCIGPSERDLRQAPGPRRLETMTGCPSRPEVLVGEMHTKASKGDARGMRAMQGSWLAERCLGRGAFAARWARRLAEHYYSMRGRVRTRAIGRANTMD